MLAEKVGADTLLSQIIQMVNDASRSRAPIQKLADSIAKYFVPAVIGISLITFVVWALYGPEPAMVYGFVNAIAVLIISCPCALGLATPMSVMVGVGKGAQSGVLIKNAEALETLQKIDVLITDKTGTITEGKPSVIQVYSQHEGEEGTLAGNSRRPQSTQRAPTFRGDSAIRKSQQANLPESSRFEALPGKGILGLIDNHQVAMGNTKLFDQLAIGIEPELKSKVEQQQRQGHTVSYIAADGTCRGFIAISDAIKASSRQAIAALLDKGIQVIMMTGDNANTAAAVANELGLSDFEAECLPEDKLNRVKNLQAGGKVVAMTGDGINDSPALAQANIGIAMGTGTDVAMESAEITLVNGDLTGILKAVQLSHAVMANIRQNLFFAFIYNALGVPIAGRDTISDLWHFAVPDDCSSSDEFKLGFRNQ